MGTGEAGEEAGEDAAEAAEELQQDIPERVRRVLDAAGLEALVFAPGSTPTSPLAAEQIGCAVGQIAKSIVVKSKAGQFAVIVAAGDRRLCSKKLKQLMGSKTRMATAEETLAATGYRPGGVCPFDLGAVTTKPEFATTPVWIDRSLASWDRVYPAAGTDASGVPTDFDQLLETFSARMRASSMRPPRRSMISAADAGKPLRTSGSAA